LQSAPNFSNFYGDPNRADLSSLAEVRSRILNMQFNVEKRTRELLDQRQVQRSTVQLAPPIESTKPPEWLRQKELEDELKKLSATQFERNLNEIPTRLIDDPPRVEPQKAPVKEVESKVEDKPAPVISSNRQIIFGLNSAAKPAEVEPPKMGKSLFICNNFSSLNFMRSILETTQNQYNRMLDILRPKQAEISSSDESDTPLTKQQVGSGQLISGSLSGTKAE
jgi:hypothetical protein